ncbi:MAG: EF-P 5-aminopentanol modification-associated protein YfmH [Hominimerdicola sp.]
MNREVIENSRLGEKYTLIHHKSGLDIYIWKLEGFSTTEACFGTKYGSINTRFKTKDKAYFTQVPEGIAHYLEHKLFENEDCDVFELYAKTGASGNAYTSFDETVYTFSCSENYEESLEILLDFVQNPYFTEETVAKEQGIIGQEIKMCQDSPDRQCFFNLLKALYFENPVKIDIAGTVESIAKITPELLYECYNTFYNLHNMVLTIAGNVDEDKVLEICDRKLKPCEDMQLETDFPKEPEGIVQQRITAKFPVGQPIFSIGFKAEPAKGKEILKQEATASVLLHMLIGSTSKLYKDLFDEGLLNSRFGIEVFLGEGFLVSRVQGESHDPDEVFKRYMAEIERVKKEGLDKEQFEIIKKSKYGNLVRSFNNPEHCADDLVECAFCDASPFDEVEYLASLTLEDCQKGLDTFFDIKKAAISIVEK